MLTEDELIDRLVVLMGCDEALAKQYLIRAKWRLWDAVGEMEHDINVGLLCPFGKRTGESC